MTPFAIFLMGPTASGKTALAATLVRALPCEIISVDSAQIYRGMDLGSGKPGPAILAEAPHHLIDILDPSESYSAASFRSAALAVMRDIAARGRIPLLAGGSMLYFKALREGLSDLPPADEAVREQLSETARQRGWPHLHAELARVDPLTASRLQPEDAQRIQRALEVFYVTGQPLSAQFVRSPSAPMPYHLLSIALLPGDRAQLHGRIALRFDAMLDAGLIAEVAQLRRQYRLSAELPSMRCVGYRQVWQYLEGRFDRAELRERAIAATRQLAKRQLTWLRTTPEVSAFDCFDPDTPAKVHAHLAHALARRKADCASMHPV
jgi:tRNA dimethylallyltransferase